MSIKNATSFVSLYWCRLKTTQTAIFHFAILTHQGLNKMTSILQTTFSTENYSGSFTETCSYGFNWQQETDNQHARFVLCIHHVGVARFCLTDAAWDWPQPFSQWQRSFQMKAALSLAKTLWISVMSCETGSRFGPLCHVYMTPSS